VGRSGRGSYSHELGQVAAGRLMITPGSEFLLCSGRMSWDLRARRRFSRWRTQCCNWPLRAARELGQAISWPVQYLRAAPEGSQARAPIDLKNLESSFEEQHAIPER